MRTSLHTGLMCGLLALGIGGCAGEKAEGRPWIHQIRYIGLHSISRRDLGSKLAIQETGLVRKRYLDPYAVPGDRERIEAYYRAHGYYSAHVVRADVKPRKNDSVDIEFKIEEGSPTKLSAITIGGLELGIPNAKKRKQFIELLPLKQGLVFVHEDYLTEKSLLREHLKMAGYAWPRVRGEVDVDRDVHTASVALSVTPGVLAHIGRVEVGGYNQVRANDIIRTADLTTGRVYSPEDIETARGRVYNLGMFASVRLNYTHDPEDPSSANVRIEVLESTFRELRVGGGFTIEAQRNDVHLFVQYTKRNFLGGLRVLRLRFEPAFVAVPAVWSPQRLGPALATEVEFKQPFLFGLRHFDLRWVVGYDLGIDYYYQYHGPRTLLGVNYGVWRNRIQLGLSYNFQYLLFFATDPEILKQPQLAGSLYGYVNPYRVGWWQQDLSLDLRDKPLDPHLGAYFLVSVEEGGVYAAGAFQYEKIVPDARVYLPLGRRVTFAARAQFGQIWTQGELGSPTTRRLYLGGPSSHRGFGYNRLSYQVASGNSNVPPLPIGGDQSLLIQGELRVHIVKLWNNWFGAVAFADGGDVAMPRCQAACAVSSDDPNHPAPTAENTLQAIQFSQLHWAVGGGLRYATVIGTIRFDVGVRLNRLQNSAQLLTPDPGSRIAYHLSVGESF